MRIEVKKWGNSAAIRIPSAALEDSGIGIGQILDLQVKNGYLVMAPENNSLEGMLARITPENMHQLVLEDDQKGKEAW